MQIIYLNNIIDIIPMLFYDISNESAYGIYDNQTG